MLQALIAALVTIYPWLLKTAARGGTVLGKAHYAAKIAKAAKAAKAAGSIGRGLKTGAHLAGKGAMFAGRGVKKNAGTAAMTLWALSELKNLMGGEGGEAAQDPMAGFPMPGDMGQEETYPPQMMSGGSGELDFSQLLLPPMPTPSQPMPPAPQLPRSRPRQFYQ